LFHDIANNCFKKEGNILKGVINHKRDDSIVRKQCIKCIKLVKMDGKFKILIINFKNSHAKNTYKYKTSPI
jgi:hypothetical protein